MAATVVPAVTRARNPDTSSLLAWLEAENSPALKTITDHARVHRAQILVSEVTRADNNERLLRRGFRVDAEYFYPASAIKVFAAAAALKWVEEHASQFGWLTIDTPLVIPASSVQRGGERLAIAPHQPAATIRDVVKDTLIVSSNTGFNWLYDVVGPHELHTMFWRAGIKSLMLRHRLSARGFPRTIQSLAPPVVDKKRGLEIAPLREHTPLPTGASIPIGESHIASGELVSKPMDFADRNAVSLRDLQRFLILLVRPQLLGQTPRLNQRHTRMLRTTLATLAPNAKDQPDGRIRYKPLMSGLVKGLGDQAPLLHVESKAGRAYGFIVDNAYVRFGDRELFVTATVYVNPNQVVGDNDYAYREQGWPFFEALGFQLARRLVSSSSQHALH